MDFKNKFNVGVADQVDAVMVMIMINTRRKKQHRRFVDSLNGMQFEIMQDSGMKIWNTFASDTSSAQVPITGV